MLLQTIHQVANYTLDDIGIIKSLSSGVVLLTCMDGEEMNGHIHTRTS